jgi:hypothetical protein
LGSLITLYPALGDPTSAQSPKVRSELTEIGLTQPIGIGMEKKGRREERRIEMKESRKRRKRKTETSPNYELYR